MKPERQDYLSASGEKYPSVTEILQCVGYGTDSIAQWACNLGKQGKDYLTELEHAAMIGSCVHSRIEAEISYSSFVPMDWPPDVVQKGAKAFSAFQAWLSLRDVKLLSHEVRCVSETFRCGGTYDAIVKIDGGPPVLIDFKTSKYIYEKNIAQVAAYLDMVNEVFQTNLTEARILRFGKNGSCEELLVSGEILDRGRQLFWLAQQMFNLKSQMEWDTKASTWHATGPKREGRTLTMLGVAHGNS